MCGIIGAIDLTGNRLFPEQILRKMAGAIAHRGPDDESVHIEPGVALGARRLSIIDVAGGRQPMCNETGEIWGAFNGEVFDYPQLREQLLSRGHQLKTHCDTEAWVHLYEDFGEEVFANTYGQFAVSLWDRNNRKLLLGRDRPGISPLYYTQVDGWLLWSSEVKGLLASGMVTPRPNVRGIDYFFNFFCLPNETSLFENITMLPPGHQLIVQNGQVNKHCYWDLDFPDQGQERRFQNEEDAVSELKGLLAESVERRLFSEVPVCCYISGGIDSTMVLGLCSQVREEPIQSFSISLPESGPVDERFQAAESADVLNCPLDILTLTGKDITHAYPELVRAAEGPVTDSSTACLMLLARRVREQGFKVTLTGEGADELLAGYVWFKYAPRNQFIGRYAPYVVRSLLQMISGIRGRHLPPPFAFHQHRPAQQITYEMMGLARELFYANSMWERLGDYTPYEDIPGRPDRFEKWHPLNRSLYTAYKVMLPGLLLAAKSDRITMNSSVEGRYPFLDERVVEFCSSIDPQLKLNGRTEKYLLRKVLSQTLPMQLANRKKTMFRAHRMELFLREDRPHWVDQLLSEEAISQTGYFHYPAIQAARAQMQKLSSRSLRKFILDMGLIAVMSTQLWHHQFIEGTLADLPSQANDGF